MQAAKEKYNEKSDLSSTNRKNISGNAVTKTPTKPENKKKESGYSSMDIYERWKKSNKQTLENLTGKKILWTNDGVAIVAEKYGFKKCGKCSKPQKKGELIATRYHKNRKSNKCDWTEAIHLRCYIKNS